MDNDKDETHRLSCPSYNTSLNAKGKMPMQIICPHCRTFLNVKVLGASEEEQEKNVSKMLKTLVDHLGGSNGISLRHRKALDSTLVRCV